MFTRSESLSKFAAAVVAFGAEVENPKNTAKNPFLHNSYAPLQDILSYVRPLLSKHGLAVIQTVYSEGDAIGVCTTLMHSSGEYVSDTVSMVPGAAKGTSAAQQAGGVVTYLRRYSLSAILNIASEGDDDGNAPKEKPAQKPAEKPTDDKITAAAEEMKIALKELEGEDGAVIDGYRIEGARAYKARDIEALRDVVRRARLHGQQAYKEKQPADEEGGDLF